MRYATMLTTTILLAFSSMAGAQTQLNHGAGFCQKVGSGGTLARYYQGTVGNSSVTQDLRLLCPMVRVSGKSTTGVVNVHVTDRSRDKGIRCSFYDQRSYGHKWRWTGWTSTRGSGPTNFKTFVWPAATSQDRYDGFHHVHCVLPPKDSLYGDSILASYSSGD